MPRILVITIHTAGHYQFQNGIDLSTYPTWTIRQKSHRAKVTKVYGARATGRTLVQRRLTFRRTPIGRHGFVLFVGPKRAEVRCQVLCYEIFNNLKHVHDFFDCKRDLKHLRVRWQLSRFFCLFVCGSEILLTSCCS